MDFLESRTAEGGGIFIYNISYAIITQLLLCSESQSTALHKVSEAAVHAQHRGIYAQNLFAYKAFCPTIINVGGFQHF